MTWKGHLVANAALGLAITGKPLVAAAAMIGAALPDQLEAALPIFRHRGSSHWLALWATVFAAAALLPAAVLVQMAGQLPGMASGRANFVALLHECAVGLALGPLLHTVVDGCSSAGVPVGPFCPWKLRLGLYRTRQTRRWTLDVSETVFLVVLLLFCAVAWKVVEQRQAGTLPYSQRAGHSDPKPRSTCKMPNA